MTTGDIYAFYNERLDCWHACQITGFCDEDKDRNGRPQPAVLLLDWSENRLPTPEDFPFLRAFHLRDNNLSHNYCEGLKPKGFTYCGNYHPLESKSTARAYGRWARGLFGAKINIPQHLGTYVSTKERLDFRGTANLPPQINLTSVKEVYLHDAVFTLWLEGVFEPDLQIHDPHNGRFLWLRLWGNTQIPKGLEQLQRLQIAKITDIDFTETFETHKEIDELWLSGKPGNIRNFSAISTLKKLRWLVVEDLFGYSSADFPTPKDLPALESLWLHSIPYDVAQTAKKLYKPLIADDYAFELDILKARKPEWLAENLNNPFRSWDGDEMIPRGGAKKAADIYKKTKTALLSVCQSDSANVQEESLAICKAYIDVFHAMDRKHEFIETVYAEDIMVALNNLITEAAEASDGKLDAAALIEVCDGLREF